MPTSPPALVRFLRAVLGELIERVAAERPDVRGLLAPFADVVLADATVIKLHRLLAGSYPGTRTHSSPAAAKLYLVYSVLGGGVRHARLTDERTCEHRALRVGPWVRDRLLIFDLGYFRYRLFDGIARNGGHFLSRLPRRANPLIVGVHRRWRGRQVPLVGRHLDDMAGRLEREELDVEVQFRHRGHAGRRRTGRRRLRLVGVREPGSGVYRFYLTNIAPAMLDAQGAAQVHAARWRIELVFRQMKSHYRLESMPSAKGSAVEASVLATLITQIVSGELLAAVRQRVGEHARRPREERRASVFATVATSVLDVMTLPPSATGVPSRRLKPMLLHGAIDPNARRSSLPHKVDRESVSSR